MTHKNNKFLKIDNVDIGEEVADALKSELIIIDPKRLNSIMQFVNKQNDKIIVNKMNSRA